MISRDGTGVGARRSRSARSKRPGGLEHLDLREASVVTPLSQTPRDRTREERTGEGEAVVLPVLAAGVDRQCRDVANEIRSYRPAEPGHVERGALDAGDHGTAADVHELGEERGRIVTPPRLDVLETRCERALLVPGADVGEMDVAEHETGAPRAAEVHERRRERSVEALPRR